MLNTGGSILQNIWGLLHTLKTEGVLKHLTARYYERKEYVLSSPKSLWILRYLKINAFQFHTLSHKPNCYENYVDTIFNFTKKSTRLR